VHGELAAEDDAWKGPDEQQGGGGRMGISLQQVSDAPAGNEDGGDDDGCSDDPPHGNLEYEDERRDDKASGADGSHADDQANDGADCEAHGEHPEGELAHRLRVGVGCSITPVLPATAESLAEDHGADADEENTQAEGEVFLGSKRSGFVAMESGEDVSTEHSRGCCADGDGDGKREFGIFLPDMLGGADDVGDDCVEKVGGDSGDGVHSEEDHERRSHEGGPTDARKSHHESHEEAESYFC
jgi:hypothetical protein